MCDDSIEGCAYIHAWEHGRMCICAGNMREYRCMREDPYTCARKWMDADIWDRRKWKNIDKEDDRVILYAEVMIVRL